MSMLTISPHVHTDDSVQKIMTGVMISLIPAALVSFYFFGLPAIILTLVSILSCVAVEYLIQRFIMKEKPSVTDGFSFIINR